MHNTNIIYFSPILTLSFAEVKNLRNDIISEDHNTVCVLQLTILLNCSLHKICRFVWHQLEQTPLNHSVESQKSTKVLNPHKLHHHHTHFTHSDTQRSTIIECKLDLLVNSTFPDNILRQSQLPIFSHFHQYSIIQQLNLEEHQLCKSRTCTHGNRHHRLHMCKRLKNGDLKISNTHKFQKIFILKQIRIMDF